MSKTIWTSGPKCPDCLYGLNTGVTLPEQSDIDIVRDRLVSNGMDPVNAMAFAKELIPNAHIPWTPEREAEIRADQLASAASTLAGHCADDGSCVFDAETGERRVDPVRAALPIERRMAILKAVVGRPDYATKMRAKFAEAAEKDTQERRARQNPVIRLLRPAPAANVSDIARVFGDGSDTWTVAQIDAAVPAAYVAKRKATEAQRAAAEGRVS